METILQASAIHAGYGRVPVLQGIDVGLQTGEIVGVLGPNGSGKSTLVRILCGRLEPSAGEVRLRDELLSLWTAPARAREIAVVPQSAPVLFAFSVREFVTMGRYPHAEGLRPMTPSDAEAVERALAWAQVEALAQRPMDSLSGGEVQRVLLARAMAQDAPITLLDEPAAHLDLKHQARLFGIVRRWAASGKALLVVLHDLNLAAEFCDRLLLLDEGRVVAEGRPHEVLEPGVIERVYGIRPGMEHGQNPRLFLRLEDAERATIDLR